MFQTAPSLGEILLKARKRQELTLEQIELDTHIRPQYIEALENRDYSKLPAEIYLTQILKTYCDYLGLSFGSIRTLYIKEHRQARRSDNLNARMELAQRILPPKKDAFIRPDTRFSAFAISSRTLVTAFAIMVLGLMAGYLGNMISDFSSKPDLTVAQPMDGVTVNGKSVMVNGRVDPNTVLTVNGTELAVDQNGDFSVEVDLQKGANDIALSATNKTNNETAQKNLMVFADFPETKLSDYNYNGELVMEVEATTGDSWLSVMPDDKETPLFTGILGKGQTRRFVAREKIYVVAGSVGDLRVIVNGEDQGMLGGRGEVARLTFGREGQDENNLISFRNQ